jgi:hypothetical protein
MKFGTALSFFTDVQGKISDKLRIWNYPTVAAGETQLSAPPQDRISIPTWDDELYLEFYRGTYTTQAAQKANIRKIEEGMLNSEKCASLACLECRTYPAMSSISPPPGPVLQSGAQRADALCYTVFAGAITRVVALEYQVCAAPKERRGPDRQPASEVSPARIGASSQQQEPAEGLSESDRNLLPLGRGGTSEVPQAAELRKLLKNSVKGKTFF